MPRSRAQLLRPAMRPQTHAKILLAGPSGSGKSLTALRIARGLAGPGGRIAGIDSEHNRLAFYAEHVEFDVLDWEAPYDPADLCATLLDLQQSHQVVVIDSIYHWWGGAGGVLDIVDKNAPKGNQFAGWKVGRPEHAALVDTIMGARCHIVAACRAKMAYEQQGSKIVQIGEKPQQDDGLVYDLDVGIMQAMNHSFEVVTSRLGDALPQGKVWQGDQAEEFGQTYADWAIGGEPLADPDAIADLIERMNTEGFGGAARRGFKQRFGNPRNLRQSQLADAHQYVIDREATADSTEQGEG